MLTVRKLEVRAVCLRPVSVWFYLAAVQVVQTEVLILVAVAVVQEALQGQERRVV